MAKKENKIENELTESIIDTTNSIVNIEDTEVKDKTVYIEEDKNEVVDIKEDKNNIVYGEVSNCLKLNIREEADKDSNILDVLNVNDTVKIDLDKSTDLYYCINYLVDDEYKIGFVVKEFIELKENNI